jgi:DtxR family manganese transport transcriptional regulator
MPRVAVKTPAASARQAESFRRSRRDRALEIIQDYVEAIAGLGGNNSGVRVVDLARQMGVTHVTVNHTISRLQSAGYVSMQPYQAIFLTGPGQKLARECRQRHATVVAFLRSLGVSEKTAELDAEGIEHHVSAQTLAAFRAALRAKSR